MSPLIAALAAVLVLAFLTVPARAAEDPRERQGRALYAKGEYQAALEVYANLFAEKGDPLYLRNIGRCNQKLRRPDQAIDAFRDYLRRARKVKPEEREEIEGYIKEMEDLRTRTAEKAAEKERERARDQAFHPVAEPTQTEARPPTAQEQPPPPRPVPLVAVSPLEEGAASREAERRPRGSTTVEESTETRGSPPARAGQTGTFFLALAAGSGFGLASGTGDLNPKHTLAVDGFARAQLGHLAPEIGVFLAPRLLLSAQMRLQYVAFVTGEYLTGVCGGNYETYCQPSPLSLAAFGRLAWLTGDGPAHFLVGLAAGGGNIKHAQVFEGDTMCNRSKTSTCVDTLSSGPFLFGPSIGILVELGGTVGLLATVNTQIGVPKFTLNFDFNAGLSFRL